MTNEEMASMIEDLEAERNSLREENARCKESQKKIEEELRKTKELNFTLSRQVGTQSKSAEEILAEMF